MYISNAGGMGLQRSDFSGGCCDLMESCPGRSWRTSYIAMESATEN